MTNKTTRHAHEHAVSFRKITARKVKYSPNAFAVFAAFLTAVHCIDNK